MKVKLLRSPNKEKKYRVEFMNPDTGRKNTVDFGQYGASDYTIHKDYLRMLRYLHRHTNPNDWVGVSNKNIEHVRSSKENWNNPTTAGFWSRWLLWSKPSLSEAKQFMSKKFGIDFVK